MQIPPPLKRTVAMTAQCIRFGVACGLFLSVLVLVDYLIVGKSLFDRYGPLMNLWTVAALYIGGGAVAGLIAGLLHPLWRWMVGAWLVGTIAALPVMTMIGATMNNFSHWDGGDTIITIICSMALGGSFGVHMRWRHYRPTRRE